VIKLADRPDLILQFIRRYQSKHGYPPSIRDITSGVGLASPSTAHRHLLTLRSQGRVTWQQGKMRTLRVL